MTLKTVRPTGRTTWPRILLEGTEQSGKKWAVAELSASDRVGRTVVLVLGEDASTWHEYGRIPGSRFEIAEHDGTWASIIDAAKGARAAAEAAVADGEPPFVFCVATMTAVWEGLKDQMSHRAVNSSAGRRTLEADPDAGVDIPSSYWNDANERHGELMTVLLTFPGIVIMIARGDEVTLFEDGKAAKVTKTPWNVQVHKRVLSASTAHLRLSNRARPLLIGSKGVSNPVRPGIDPPRRLPDDWTLESVIFGTLGLDASAAAVGGYTEMQPDMTPEQIRDEAVNPWTPVARIRELYEIARQAHYGMTLANENAKQEQLAVMLGRIGAARAKARQGLDPNDAWLEAFDGMPRFSDPEKMRAEMDTAFAAFPASDPRLMGLREAYSAKIREITVANGAKPDQAEATREEPAQAETPAFTLEPDDPWLKAIRDITAAGDDDKLRVELDESFSKPETAPRLKALTAVLDVHMAELAARQPVTA